ncbi:unnamed protein product [Timema podura]|uniref:Uncharacterized protein n=1 Tax=Timema podura TaxID=61482 RepID=A0ABN7PBQ0_TIMPD|nr:unnamed protein product [Timema podura]
MYPNLGGEGVEINLRPPHHTRLGLELESPRAALGGRGGRGGDVVVETHVHPLFENLLNPPPPYVLSC